jgi:hypothetical protein
MAANWSLVNSKSCLRVNRRSIVWLAARHQGRFALSPFDFHLDDAHFAKKLAIKASRGSVAIAVFTWHALRLTIVRAFAYHDFLKSIRFSSENFLRFF